jgi:Na+-driven multidrug efflux pump
LRLASTKIVSMLVVGFRLSSWPFWGKANAKEVAEELAKAATSGLVVALAIGLLQFACFTLLAEPIVRASGISPSTNTCRNTMYATAVSYTRARATSAPSSTVWLVTTGIFRGTVSFSMSQVRPVPCTCTVSVPPRNPFRSLKQTFLFHLLKWEKGLGDATTPLYFALLFNGLNIVLNYLFVTKLQMVGIVRGVPLLTTVAQTLALIPLLLRLHKKVPFLPFLDTRTAMTMTVSDLVDQFRRYCTAGIYLLGRSIVRLSAISYCTRYAVRLSVPSVGEQNRFCVYVCVRTRRSLHFHPLFFCILNGSCNDYICRPNIGATGPSCR